MVITEIINDWPPSIHAGEEEMSFRTRLGIKVRSVRTYPDAEGYEFLGRFARSKL